jgi:hypothetical protein
MPVTADFAQGDYLIKLVEPTGQASYVPLTVPGDREASRAPPGLTRTSHLIGRGRSSNCSARAKAALAREPVLSVP